MKTFLIVLALLCVIYVAKLLGAFGPVVTAYQAVVAKVKGLAGVGSKITPQK